jgi:phosphate transport system protein
MSVHLQREIQNLKKSILSLSAEVEERVWKAVKSMQDRNPKLAQTVIDGDIEIDRKEVEVEEECLKILALYQPVAIDLRFIVAVLKINNDLERIGDLAANIAKRSAYLSAHERIDVPFDFNAMAQKAQWMLRKSLDALVNMDVELARQVCAADDEVDKTNRDMYEWVKGEIRSNPEHLDRLLALFRIARHLERIADAATNIAEDVIYMAEGDIVRHHVEDYEPRSSDRPKPPS